MISGLKGEETTSLIRSKYAMTGLHALFDQRI
jgi:hypothetical protein